MKQNRILILLLLVMTILLSGCSLETMVEDLLDLAYYELSTGDGDASSVQSHVDEIIDPTKFYVKKVPYSECTEYWICYKNDETEIAFLGLENSNFYIIDHRIYYTNGGLFSVNYYGEDQKQMVFDDENILQVVRITRVEDGWLYCQVEQREETDNPHETVVTRGYKIKPDFSEYCRS